MYTEIEKNNNYESIINDVITNGFGVLHNFFSKELINQLKSNFDKKTFRAAGIGNNQKFTHNDTIRNDEISWIDTKNPHHIAEKTLVNELEQFMNYLNYNCFTGLRSFEFHYARYKPGSFYKRHIDQFRSDTSRKFTLIIYLNTNWKPEHGGQLILYLPGKPIEIKPLAGTIVFFESNKIEHEVLTCHSERLSITGWFKTT